MKQITFSFQLIDTQLSAKKVDVMSVYPNPVSRKVALQFEVPKGLMAIYLYDLLGRAVGVYETSQVANGDSYILDVSSIPNGTYFISSRGDDGSLYQKQIVIKK